MVQRAAATATGRFPLPRAWLQGTYDFSFSGLKTALWHLVHRGELAGNPGLIANVAASFQDAVVDVLVRKAVTAAEELNATCIMVSGGVAANSALRGRLAEEARVPVLVPPLALCTDNAAMVAACAYFAGFDRPPDGADMDVAPALNLC